ncbi:hypothetical protein [Wenxinia saemankumensis]|uniref:Uncharacterized protein n=1 Tax=Wenxinia saemankumensis TaxID=1447782 RepID=A0A1M6AQ94_9RHOB|nr:hypothetical protein [Wenxinia saemankumensis]SHI38660.1 hypothetical protein SAMN05444417_0564 [Wenxinia saemankumensis]
MPAASPLLWLVGAILSALILYGALFATRQSAAVRGLFAQFFLLAFLPLLVLLGVPLALLSLLVEMDERVWQALIAGVVIVAGWLTTAIFDRLARARDKAERLRDTHKALFAEIRSALSAIHGGGEGGRWGAEVLDRMRREPDFVPFVPAESHDQIFDAVVGTLDVLPRVTIDPTVAFYKQIKDVGRMAEDLRSPRFIALPQQRRIAMFADFLQMRQVAFTLGEYALSLIAAFAEGGTPAAERAAERFSSRAGGPSDPSPGSA